MDHIPGFGSDEDAVLCKECASDKEVDSRYASPVKFFNPVIVAGSPSGHWFVNFLKGFSWIVLLFSIVMVIIILHEGIFFVTDLTWLFLCVPCFIFAYMLEFLYDIRNELRKK